MSVEDALARHTRLREMTLDLLASLDDDSMRFAPGPGFGPLWQQFRHLGRIEDNYATARSRLDRSPSEHPTWSVAPDRCPRSPRTPTATRSRSLPPMRNA